MKWLLIIAAVVGWKAHEVVQRPGREEVMPDYYLERVESSEEQTRSEGSFYSSSFYSSEQTQSDNEPETQVIFRARL